MDIALWIFGFAFVLCFVGGPIIEVSYAIIKHMNKKQRKVTVRHDRHVANNNFKTIIDTGKLTPEELEECLYEKKTKHREAKRG